MLYVEEYVHANRIKNVHPFEKFAFSLVTMCICLIAGKEEISLFVIVLMTGVLIFKAGIPLHVVIKLFSIPLSFLVIGVFTVTLTVNESSAGMLLGLEFFGHYLGFTQESIRLACKTFLMSLSAVSCLYFLALTTPMTDIIFVFQALRLPRIVIEQMMLMYRFIFIFLDTAFEIYTAQASRWGYSSIGKSLSSLGILFANLWGKSFFRAKALFTSLTSRGYLEGLRVLNPAYTFSLENIGLIIFIETLLIAAANY